MTQAPSRGMTEQRQHQIPVRRVLTLLIAIGGLGISSGADATALTVPVSSTLLQFENLSPSILFGSGGERVRYGANNVVPNGDAATNGVGVATTGSATTVNLATGNTISRNINFDPGPADPDYFQGSFLISANPLSYNNPQNLTNPWTITFQNSATTNTSVSNTLSLQGGEIPFVNSVTLSGTSAKAYPSASGATKCCNRRGWFVIEHITNISSSGDADDRLSSLVDRVPAALCR